MASYSSVYHLLSGALYVGISNCLMSAYFTGFCLERFPLPLGAWDGLRYFIVAPLSLPYNYFALCLPFFIVYHFTF